MNQSEKSHCPRCSTEADIMKLGYDGIGDKIVKQTSEEIVVEISCKDNNCSRIWRAVFAFVGNQ